MLYQVVVKRTSKTNCHMPGSAAELKANLWTLRKNA